MDSRAILLLITTFVAMKTQMLLTNKETGEQKVVDAECVKDECNRPTTTMEGLSALKPVFDENGSVTAGNSSQMSDGASITLVMSEEKALELGLKPKAYFRGFTTVELMPSRLIVCNRPVVGRPIFLYIR